MVSVGFVLTGGMMSTGTTLPLEMWRTADARWAARERGRRVLHAVLLGVDEAPVRSQAGLTLSADRSVSGKDQFDVIYLPALWRNPRPVIARSGRLFPWLIGQHERGATIAAVGTGCTLLAETGLLDGKAATTHWYYFEPFARDYPKVDLKREYFITQAGNLYCAASINALADVTVHLIERHCGREVASYTERQFSYEVRRPYEKYRFLAGKNRRHPDELIVEVQSWLADHQADAVSLGDVAARFGVSTRTLLRRFKLATDETPARYLRGVRIDTAKALLDSTNLGIGDIADRVGMQDPRQFARVFREREGVSPREYRRTVRSKLFSVE
jgi:transcriptional regulator GlxA family with amidase domain